MQVTLRDGSHHVLLQSASFNSMGYNSPAGNSHHNLKRRGSPLQQRARTPLGERNPFGSAPGCGQQQPSTATDHSAHGSLRDFITSVQNHNDINSKSILNLHQASNLGLLRGREYNKMHNYQMQLDTTTQSRKRQVREWGNRPLSEVDPDLWEIMQREKSRQWRGIELIASENFTSLAVLEALGSHLTNKYSEGLPGNRCYKGNEFIDQIESLCCSRALTAFHLDPERWGVNVQPYSCSTANFAVYTALLQPNDRIMGLDVLSGGHVSHGYHTHSGKKISAASMYFQTLPFKVHPETGLIDYEKLEEIAVLYRPKILICGGSSYPREWNYARFRQVADKINAILMCDMAHISGLVVAQECQSPFDYCDVITTTTHKSLRGPRGGMVFYRKGLKTPNRPVDGQYSFEKEINFAIHPTLQGGPHNNHIAALAAALKQAASLEYKTYIQQVKKNAQALADGLKKRGCKLVTDGTDNHLMLWDLRPFGITGSLLEEVCEACHVTVNKNAVYGDSSSWQPGGVRIGTPAMTSRGCIEQDFDVIAEFLHRAVQITAAIHKETSKSRRDFVKGLANNPDIAQLRARVEDFATAFEMPGFDMTAEKQFNS